MPKVHTQKAAKDYPSYGIKKGDIYYSWSFRYGGRRISAKYPRPSQLTQSKMSAALAAGEALDDAIESATCPQDLIDAMETAAADIESVADEYQEGLDNSTTQSGPVYEEAEEKVSNLQDWAQSITSDRDEIEGMDGVDEWDTLSSEAQKELLQTAKEVAQNNSGCPF